MKDNPIGQQLLAQMLNPNSQLDMLSSVQNMQMQQQRQQQEQEMHPLVLREVQQRLAQAEQLNPLMLQEAKQSVEKGSTNKELMLLNALAGLLNAGVGDPTDVQNEALARAGFTSRVNPLNFGPNEQQAAMEKLQQMGIQLPPVN